MNPSDRQKMTCDCSQHHLGGRRVPRDVLHVGTVDASARYADGPVTLELTIGFEDEGRPMLEIGPYQIDRLESGHLFQLLSIALFLFGDNRFSNIVRPAAKSRRHAEAVWRRDLARNARGVVRDGLSSEGEILP